MVSDRYIWFVWSIVFLVLWGIIFAGSPDEHAKIWKTSLFTMLFGLTEPLFVPRCWDQPSLFDLAQKTGFDVESLIFSVRDWGDSNRSSRRVKCAIVTKWTGVRPKNPKNF
jgi:hypothetical protein